MAGAGDLLVWGFLGLTLTSTALRAGRVLLAKERQTFDMRRLSRLLLFAALADLAVLLVVWEFLFLTNDSSFFYVWDHSAAEHTALWKAEGLWAGQEGSVFLWTLSMTTALTINEVWSGRRARAAGGAPTTAQASDERLGDWTALFASIVITSFAIVLAASDWFRLTVDVVEPAIRAAYPTGFGLSPSLRTELNVIHPPIELTGYALCVMPMSAAFAYLATGDNGWIRYCTFWTRIAWVFLTLGLTLGGLWAYITLGWGGYWAWDPVEVASLLPWLAVTALLHAQLMHRRHKMYPLAAPLLAAIAFCLTEFGTFVTRSGAWTSVHSFIQTPGSNLGAAIGNALASDPRLSVFFMMSFVPLGLLFILLQRFLRLHYEDVSFLPERGKDEDLATYVSQDKFAVFAGIFSLCVVLLMTFVILVKNAGVAPVPSEYETKLAFPVFVILFFMTVNFLRRPLGSENALLVAIVASFGAIMGYILWPAPPAQPYWKLAGAAIPMCAAVVIMAATRIRGALRRAIPSSLKARARTIGIIAIHLGVAGVVLGYALSNTLGQEERVVLQQGASPNPAGADIAFGYRFALTNISKDGNAGATPREYWDKFEARYLMYDAASGALVRDGMAFIIYKRPGPSASPDNFAYTNYAGAPVIHTDVYTSPARDLYIQVNNILPGTTNGTVAVELSVKEIPGVWGIWGGVTMMIGGMVTLMSTEYRAGRRGGEKLPAVDVALMAPQAPAPESPGTTPTPESAAPSLR